MKKWMKNSLSIIFIACLLVSNFYIPKVEAKTLGDIKEELRKFKEDYENNKLQQDLTQEEINKIKNKITQIRDNIESIEKNIYNLEIEIEQLNNDIAEKEKEIESILAFYQISNGESAYLEYAFGAQDFTDFIYRIAVSEQLTSYNNELVEQYKQDIENSKKKSQELADKKVTLKQEQTSLQNELEKIQLELEKLSDDAMSIEDQIKAAESEIKVYTDKGCKDNEDIETCGRSILPPDTTFWRPLKVGQLTGWAGNRIDPINGSKSFHHGLDMSNSGANYTDYPVYSIANGLVVYVVTSTSYGCGGKKVFIQHNVNGSIYTSAYWHLRSVNVKEGQTVTKETQIGIMGGNPATETWDNCTTGAHLHLELSSKTFSGSITAYRTGFIKPNYKINFPGDLYVKWTDRTTKF